MELKALSQEWLFDCQARQLSPNTIYAYRLGIGYFLQYLEEEHNVTTLEQLRPPLIKQYIRMYQERGNKPSYEDNT